MTMTEQTPYILVGIDGSESALHAAMWAAAETARRRVPLRLVYAVDFGGIGTGFTLGAQRSFFEHFDAEATKRLEAAGAQVAAAYPDLVVQKSRVSGRPLPVLVELSKHALLTVVGSTGAGPVVGLLAGSVAVSLTARGHSPVVIARGASTPIGGPVVVGVVGTPNSDEAIGWAFEEAAARDVEVVAVYSWYEHSVDSEYALSVAPGWDVLESEQAQVLTDRLAPWREKYPTVRVRELLTTGKPAQKILDNAGDAQLIVVGSRGRGDFTGLFGSTSHALIHRAPCPVLVVRPQP